MKLRFDSTAAVHLLWLLSSMLVGCTSAKHSTAIPRIPQVSPRQVPAEDPLRDARDAFAAPLVNCDNAKSEWFMRQGAVAGKLASNPAAQDAAIAHLVRTASDETDQFGATLECALLDVLIAARDDKRLVEMLSQLPIEVDDADGAYIEFAIMDPFGNHQPISRFVLLFDAYDKATLPAVRANLVRAVRRAFYHSIRPSLTDEEVMQRFRTELSSLAMHNKVNLEYAYAYSPGFFGANNVVPAPLFIPRGGPDEVMPIILPLNEHHPPTWK